MKTFSIYYDSFDHLASFIKKCKLHKYRDHLIQIFTSKTEPKFIKQLQIDLKTLIQSPKIIGTTTDGIIGEKGVLVDATLIAVSVFEKTNVKTKIIEDIKQNHFHAGKVLAKELISEESKILLTFTKGLNINAEEYLQGISSASKDIIVSGGMAGDNANFDKTYVFDRDYITCKGIVGASLSGSIQYIKNYSFDWEPIGTHMRVTKSVKNRVYEINNKPASEVYAEYLGEKTAACLPAVGIEFPLILEKDGVHVGRAVLKKFDDGSLLFGGNINKNEKVRFGVGNGHLVQQEGKKRIDYLKDKEAESIFVYSCMGRRRFIPKTVDLETKKLNNIAPTAGFFTYGEFYHNKGKNYLLNETMTFLALTEKSFNFESLSSLNSDKNTNTNTTLEAIAHLANKVSKDFEYINKNLEDIVDHKVKSIEKLYYKDKLTGINNRFQLIKDFNRSDNLSLILINIDRFSDLNGFYGNLAGDEVLLALSKKIKMLTKHTKYKLYRLNSDEFALLKFSKSKKELFKSLIKDLSQQLNDSKIEYKKTTIHVDVTIGGVSNQCKKHLAYADFALKQARNLKKPYYIYNDSEKLDLADKFSRNIEMAIQIKDAIKNNRVIPYFQPIIDNHTKEIVKYECLVRLIDQNGDIISPSSFLNISKKIRLYSEVTKSMVKQSFEKFKDIDTEFSINLSIGDIEDEETLKYILKAIEDYGVANRLIIELTESEDILNYDIMFDFIKKVRKTGVRIAVDDFGSGYSNFKNLIKISPDIIKIDGSLIRNIETDKLAKITIETITNYAKKMQVETLAEFVENEKIYNITKDIGVDYSQGYYFGEPLEDI